MTQRTPNQTTIRIVAERAWQDELQNLITDPADLLARVGLGEQWLDAARKAAELFPLKVTESFANRIQPGTPNDPLLLQVLPLHAEHVDKAGFTEDPLQEAQSNPIPGLIHKYHGRVLLIAASHCAIHCRYCFRRHFPYDDNRPNRQAWQAALDYIRARPEIHEVIFSGGDPLALGDRQLAWLCEQLAEMPHVKTLRLHTRLPVVLPTRITPSLLEIVSNERFNWVCVVHSNHAQELDMSVKQAFTKLKDAGMHLLNQSVLLRDINDTVETLEDLSHSLFDMGALPYYLHALDPVAGASHFEVPETHAKCLMRALRDRLPGYLVPKWVRETAHTQAKQTLAY